MKHKIIATPDAIRAVSERPQLAVLLQAGAYLTEQQLIMQLMPGMVPVCTRDFLNVSRDAYPLPWLMREIVQNFIDENKAHLGTLDGIDLLTETQGTSRSVQIIGPWVFKEPTGIISLHSGKATSDEKLAGGNGIGLKQTILRLLRDYGVEKFTIYGEGWVVDYRLALAADMNKALKGAGYDSVIEHDWLLAEVKKSANTGRCCYEIVTDNPDVLAALDTFYELGVGPQNPYLANPSFQNDHGQWTWLQAGETGIPSGRLYVNGQVMYYGTKSDHWVGPEGITLSLNQIDYAMSIDRPPMMSYALGLYLNTLVNSLTRDELIGQLKASQHLWAKVPSESYTHPAYEVLLEQICNRFRWENKITVEEFATLFGTRFLSGAERLSEVQRRELMDKGYILCPDFFKNIQMPPVESQLSVLEAALSKQPSLTSFHHQKQAMDQGMMSNWSELKVSGVADWIQQLRSTESYTGMSAVGSDSGRYQFSLKESFQESTIFSPLIKMKTDEQKQMGFLRGLIYEGLSRNWFSSVSLGHNGYVSNYALSDSRELVVRHVRASELRETFLDVTFSGKVQDEVKVALAQPAQSVQTIPTESVPESSWLSGHFSLRHMLLVFTLLLAPSAYLVYRDQLLLPTDQITEPLPVAPTIHIPEPPKASEPAHPDKDVAQLVDSLQQAADKLHSPETHSENDELARWKKSPVYYGQHGTQSADNNTQSLAGILSQFSQAPIAASELPLDPQLEALKGSVQELSSKLGDEKVQNFQIVDYPTPNELAQLQLMRRYLELATDVHVREDLFIFMGQGAKGINIDNAIGLHRELFHCQFEEGMVVGFHELAHQYAHNHGPDFTNMMQSLFARANEKFAMIIAKLQHGQALTAFENDLLQVRYQWNELAGMKP